MNRFNFVLALVFSLMFAQVVSAQSNLVTENAPVYPGDTTYVYVPIMNMGYSDTNSMENVVVKLVPKDNFG